MDIIELLPRLHFLRFPVGNAYLWQDPDGLALIDCGIPGSGPEIAEAIESLGHRREDVRRLVLTHFHIDHVGSAADIVTWGDVTVMAHRDDAPYIRGDASGPEPRLEDWERPLLERISKDVPDAPPDPVRVDRS
jgi:glyoxylase-like metal-dependent hydrolase (beta-lactamase superfamily II)